MISILKVNRSPDRNDQFIITYGEDGDKEMLIYRRDSGKGLDVWMDGLDVCFNTCRDMIKDSQKKQQVTQDAMARMRHMHKLWKQKHGPPKNTEEWNRWRKWFEESNFDKDLIDALTSEIRVQMQQEWQQAQQNQAKQAPKAPAPKPPQPKPKPKPKAPKK